MSSSISDLEILTDMLCDDTIYDEEDKMDEEEHKAPAYYHGKALYIKKQLSQENYFNFLESFLTDFKELSEEQKDKLKEIMNIQPIIIEKKTVVNSGKKKKVNNKPKLNTLDDY